VTAIEDTLVAYGARAAAIDSALAFLDREYSAGRIDMGRAMQLRTSYGEERLVLLAEIERTVQGSELEYLKNAVERARLADPAVEADVKGDLTAMAEERGWGEALKAKIRDHRGEITGLIVSVALEVAKRVGLS
jgi:hypothetical protein